VKINVTGNSGSGKSTLARQLADSLKLPFHSLDSIVWQPGWRKTPPEQRRILEESIIEQEAWVVDGVSERVRRASDVVIYLDLPRLRCWWRAFCRSLRSLNRTRPELPEGCPEWKVLFRQVRIIRNFPLSAGMAIEREAAASPSRYLVFCETVDVESVLNLLPAPNKHVQLTRRVFAPFAGGNQREHAVCD
jgi:adenylate kinase family enzyme